MKKYSPVWVAVLGIAVGVLLAMTVSAYRQRKALFDVKYNQWQKLNYILYKVGENYVDTINVKDVTDAAVQAALNALDPHSVYMPPVELTQADMELAGNFEGIGIQFNVPNDTATVIEVIQGGPSEKAGLLPGDRLLKVDDEVIAGVKFPQDSMVRRMKGPSGTKVTVTVGRGKEQIPFEITRGKIPIHSVDASFMVNGTTGYIRLTKFAETTYREFCEAGKALLDQGMEELIVDLRDNTGGYFNQALGLSNLFLDKGDEIVYMQGLHRPKENFTADGKGFLKGVRLKVLINESSASSSEIFAGAMQDNDRGLIIGRRSFGKGLVQEPLNFNDGSGIRLTVARYYTPSGRCIQKPYSKDYGMDIYNRYTTGEMFEADSIKVDSTQAYRTAKGRTVYGGGGIVPDIFVPMDTTRTTDFYVACNRKATQMRFASAMFDKFKGRISLIDSFDQLEKVLDDLDLPSRFREYASRMDGITASDAEWEQTKGYLVPQIRALIGRFSKLGENAFYKLYMSVDPTLMRAIELE